MHETKGSGDTAKGTEDPAVRPFEEYKRNGVGPGMVGVESGMAGVGPGMVGVEPGMVGVVPGMVGVTVQETR